MLIGAIVGGIVGGSVALAVALFVMHNTKRAGDQPRHSVTVPCTGDVAQTMNALHAHLTQNGYAPCQYRDESDMWRCGNGIMTASKYIKVQSADAGILVEGFVVGYGVELGLLGATGSLPKKSCKKVIDQLVDIINRT